MSCKHRESHLVSHILYMHCICTCVCICVYACAYVCVCVCVCTCGCVCDTWHMHCIFAHSSTLLSSNRRIPWVRVCWCVCMHVYLNGWLQWVATSHSVLQCVAVWLQCVAVCVAVRWCVCMRIYLNVREILEVGSLLYKGGVYCPPKPLLFWQQCVKLHTARYLDTTIVPSGSRCTHTPIYSRRLPTQQCVRMWIYTWIGVRSDARTCECAMRVKSGNIANVKVVALCCSEFQCAAVCCSVWRCVAVCCSVCGSVLQCVYTWKGEGDRGEGRERMHMFMCVCMYAQENEERVCVWVCGCVGKCVKICR